MTAPPRLLDWRQTGTVGPPQPCRICGRPALMRDPDGRPCHKVCAETHQDQEQDQPRLTLLTSIGEDPMPEPPNTRATKTGPLTRTHHEGSGLRPRRPLLDLAADYAGRGWPVFLLGRTKRPVSNCPPCRDAGPDHDPQACICLTCHGFYAATTDLDRIGAMVDAVPRGLLAIRTGAVSGLTVIDIDPRNGGRIDRALMPSTATVASGGGGWHLLYRYPGGPLAAKLRGHPGVDIKSDGGYVVAPPSTHPVTKCPYQWVRDGVEEMPPALADACKAAPAVPLPAPSGPTPTHRARGISSPSALLAAHLDAIARAPEGTRRHTLYGAARGVARMVLAEAITPTDAITALTDAGRRAEQTERDIRTAITAGFHAEGVAA